MCTEFELVKKDEPCDYYFGNVCTGFGGKTICDFCGWDMMDHPQQKALWGGEWTIET